MPIAARDTAGKLWLSLTNLDPNLAVSIDVDVPARSHECEGLHALGARKSTA
jgi:hypothetical protein